MLENRLWTCSWFGFHGPNGFVDCCNHSVILWVGSLQKTKTIDIVWKFSIHAAKCHHIHVKCFEFKLIIVAYLLLQLLSVYLISNTFLMQSLPLLNIIANNFIIGTDVITIHLMIALNAVLSSPIPHLFSDPLMPCLSLFLPFVVYTLSRYSDSF